MNIGKHLRIRQYADIFDKSLLFQIHAHWGWSSRNLEFFGEGCRASGVCHPKLIVIMFIAQEPVSASQSLTGGKTHFTNIGVVLRALDLWWWIKFSCKRWRERKTISVKEPSCREDVDATVSSRRVLESPRIHGPAHKQRGRMSSESGWIPFGVGIVGGFLTPRLTNLGPGEGKGDWG